MLENTFWNSEMISMSTGPKKRRKSILTDFEDRFLSNVEDFYENMYLTELLSLVLEKKWKIIFFEKFLFNTMCCGLD